MNTSNDLSTFLPCRRLAARLALLLTLASPLAAQSQNCSVRSTYQMGNLTATSNIVQVDTGWQSSAVDTMQQNGGGSPGVSLFSQGTMQTQAQFGRLRIQGTGQAQNWNGNGTSLFVLQAGFGLPVVRFRDTLTVQSQGLPAGTPVQLLLRVRMSGSCVLTGNLPLVSNYSAEIRVDPASSGLGLNTIVASLSSTTGLAAAPVLTTVGATLYVEGSMTCNVDEYGVRNGPPASASYAIDLESLFDFRCLTPGAGLTFCSGTTYPSMQASVQSVGVGCGATPPTLAATVPLLGSNLVLTTSGAPAQAPVILGLAVGSPVSVPIGACTLQLDPLSAALGFVGVTDAAGVLSTAFPVSGSGALAGFSMTAQSLALAANGPFLGFAELSNGVALVLGL
ncbi:MAG: hypothetical protein ACK501_00345 [Planctomycetota bacterium]